MTVMWLNYSFFLLLAIAILLAWTVRYKQSSLYIFLLAIAIGMMQNRITSQGLLVITVLGGAHYLLQIKLLPPIYRLILHAVLMVIFVGFAYHLFPGFHNWKLIDQVSLSATSLPYTMYLNIEQPIYSYLFLFFQAKESILSKSWPNIGRWSMIAFLLTLILLLIANYSYPLIAWDPKILNSQFALVWIIRMLLSVCLVEEVFFRGYLQERLTEILRNFPHAVWIAWILSSCLFGLLHLSAGLPMFVMATLAGLGYGLAYLKTGRIESAIITHFLVNLVHIWLFSYPVLAIRL
jgi:membrane protease YdiL (CAAX protease family)